MNTQTEVEITKDKFLDYLYVQESGVTNMFDVRCVEDLSGLERAEIFEIMHNYSKYKTQFGLDNKKE